MRSVRVSAIVSMFAGALMFAAPAVAADSIYLSWSRCHGEGLGTQNRSFACDTNDGSEVIVCSFKLATPLAQVSGNEIVIDVLSQDDPLPAWWEMKDPGTCRQTGLIGFNTTQDPRDGVCVDWGQGQSEGGIGAYNSELGAVDNSLVTRHRRLKIADAVPLAAVGDLAADIEYFSCNIGISHDKTVGDGACAGCSGPVCLVFNTLLVTAMDFGNSRRIDGFGSSDSILTWQGTGPNCLLVPVENATWGQVKALYR